MSVEIRYLDAEGREMVVRDARDVILRGNPPNRADRVFLEGLFARVVNAELDAEHTVVRGIHCRFKCGAGTIVE